MGQAGSTGPCRWSPATDASDPRALRAAAKAHGEAGQKAVTGEHYEGGHWIGSFAMYLWTRRGTERSDAAGCVCEGQRKEPH